MFHRKLTTFLAAITFCAASQGGQGAPASKLTRAEQEEFLRVAKVIAHKAIGEGVTGAMRLTLEKDGFIHAAQWQKIDEAKARFESDRGVEMNFRDTFKFNIAAYELAKLLGIEDMIPPSVERKWAGSTGAMTWWVDNVLMEETQRVRKKLQSPDLNSWNREMHVVRVFDQLIYNTDRNLGNLLITKDWHIWMIDHTRAFRMRRDLLGPKNLVQCDRSLFEKLKTLDKETMKQRLGTYLTGMEIDGLLGRRDGIVKQFDALIKAKGETAVLYDRPARN